MQDVNARTQIGGRGLIEDFFGGGAAMTKKTCDRLLKVRITVRKALVLANEAGQLGISAGVDRG